MPEGVLEVRYCFQALRHVRHSHSVVQAHPLPLPRITRLMALAIKLDEIRRHCPELDCRGLAVAGRVSRPRITQILNLLNLAPDIQERLLTLVPLERGRDSITEKRIRQLTAEYDWQRQRERFECLTARPSLIGVKHG